jgi:hypothetical protein
MKLDEFKKDLELLVNQHSLDSEFNLPDFAISDYIMDSLNALMKANRLKPQGDGVDDFIERMYLMYPSRCPKRATSLGKTKKDKDRIRKLLKYYSMEEIERVFKHEIEEKYEKQYMQNFSTFLNNFPDPNALEQESLFSSVEITSEKNFGNNLIINGTLYR